MTQDNEMPLIEHLTELRVRLIYSLLSLVVGCLVCYNFSEFILDFVRRPIAPYLKGTQGGFIFTAPVDKFMAHLKISVLSGALLSSPFWFYQIWRFVAPG